MRVLLPLVPLSSCKVCPKGEELVYFGVVRVTNPRKMYRRLTARVFSGYNPLSVSKHKGTLRWSLTFSWRRRGDPSVSSPCRSGSRSGPVTLQGCCQTGGPTGSTWVVRDAKGPGEKDTVSS